MRIHRQQVATLGLSRAGPEAVAVYVQRKSLRGVLRPDRGAVRRFVAACARGAQLRHGFVRDRDLVRHLHLMFELSPAYDEHPLVARWLATRRPQDVEAMVSAMPGDEWYDVAATNSAGWEQLPGEEHAAGRAAARRGVTVGPTDPAARAVVCVGRGAEWDRQTAVEVCKPLLPRWIFSW